MFKLIEYGAMFTEYGACDINSEIERYYDNVFNRVNLSHVTKYLNEQFLLDWEEGAGYYYNVHKFESCKELYDFLGDKDLRSNGREYTNYVELVDEEL